MARFESIHEYSKNNYVEGAPIILESGALLKDTESGTMLCQFKFKSVSEKKIIALKISLDAFDISGQPLEGISDYQYLDLDVDNGQNFGAKKAIIMPEPVTRTVEINNINIVFSDGTVYDINKNEMYPLDEGKPIADTFEDEDLKKQYSIEVKGYDNYYPQEQDDLWLCTCGTWNKADGCTKCKQSKEHIFGSLDVENLTEKKCIRLEEERIAAEQRKVEAELNKAKTKKLLKIIIPIFAVAVIAIAAYSIFGPSKYPNITGKYTMTYSDNNNDEMDYFGGLSSSEWDQYDVVIDKNGKVTNVPYIDEYGELAIGSGRVSEYEEYEEYDWADFYIEVAGESDTEVIFEVYFDGGTAYLYSESSEDYIELDYKKQK